MEETNTGPLDEQLMLLRAEREKLPAPGQYDPLPDLVEVARVFDAMCTTGQIKSVRTRGLAKRALAALGVAL
ncbi:hypothetical protein [Variovorax ginsengisoli]|uniref:Uncharacterized protein n=1 Tax=Variovorax ginsengisoli TaxID=363844 RepID=A0ABT8RZF4_9BURK|nr:hypothetical protein [Variovorax ginsengisoli]MDN8612753.1 hypothetical protein [Variovorax ginsengisoli]MDO1531923.1 hypothetical protein [Variovorax ginsengisoli]